jgi:hypothetical protein
MLNKYKFISKLFKLTSKSFRKLGYDRYDYPDNRTRTGIEVSPYKPQFVLTDEERKGTLLIIQQTTTYLLKKESSIGISI